MTKMERMNRDITNEVRAKIFGLYLNANVLVGDAVAGIISMDCHKYELLLIAEEGDSEYEEQPELEDPIFKALLCDCSLILKPLSEMTEKDCIEFLLLDDRRNDYKITSARYDSDKETIEYQYSEGEGSRNMKIQFCIEVDWLRSKGYALPYLGIDLFESKIAIKP